jgi:methionyl aminopeptidase
LLEPFATYGRGKIKNGKPFIFAINDRCSGNIANEIRNRFGSLPFTPRWIPDTGINELKGAREYLELIENDDEIVAQSEHTVIVNEEGCEVITRLAK